MNATHQKTIRGQLQTENYIWPEYTIKQLAGERSTEADTATY